MDFDSIPDDKQPTPSETPQQPSKPVMFDDIPTEEAPPEPKNAPPKNFDDIPEGDEEPKDYSTLGQLYLTKTEAGAKGIYGPLAPLAEAGIKKAAEFTSEKLAGSGFPGANTASGALSDLAETLSPEEQKARARAHPYLSGANQVAGAVSSLAMGEGAIPWAIKGIEALGITSNIAKAAAVGAAITGGDEIAKKITGDWNPEDSIGASLSKTGISALITAASDGVLSFAAKPVSNRLSVMAESEWGQAISRWLQEFGSRWDFNNKNPNMVQSVYDELSTLHNTLSDASKEAWQEGGLRDEAIKKLTSGVTPDQLDSHFREVSSVFKDIPREIRQNPLFTTYLEKWQDAVTSPNTTASDVFHATDELKKVFQSVSKYGRDVSPLERPFIDATRSVSDGLKKSLENESVWNDAGELQKNINRAVSKYIPILEGSRAKMMSKYPDVGYIIDAQKIKTLVNNIGKTGVKGSEAAEPVELRPAWVKAFVESSEKYRDELNSLYSLKGIEPPFVPSSLEATKQLYGETTAGGRAADAIFRGVIPTTVRGLSKAIGVGGAEKVGEQFGINPSTGFLGEYAVGNVMANKLEPLVDRMVGRPSKKYLVPFILKAVQSAPASPAAWSEAIQHARNIELGDTGMQAGVNALFTGANIGNLKLFGPAEEKNIEKLKKFISEGGLNQQIQNSLQQSRPKATPNPQGFAHGGVVEPQPEPIKKDAGSNLHDSKLSQIYPEHAMIMAQAKGRVINYLNSLRPIDTPASLPFDTAHKDPEKERAYERAIHLADKPLSIVHHIQKGTLEPEQIDHMKQMWPEVYNSLSKKMTMKMAEARLNNEKMPPYHVRQSMALFLGAPLDSSMTPSGIMAAQAVFAKQKMMAQALGNQKPGKAKKDTSKLGQLTKEYQTNSQAAASRQLTQK
jgi:hypothetical protein